MFKWYRTLLRGVSLVILLAAGLPVNQPAQAAAILPPGDMFQLPWDLGVAWVALDGFDDGSSRLPGSPHNYLNGGAVDFAPRANMIQGENTSNFWVTAAAAGTVFEVSRCHIKINHGNGFITEYQHLTNIQVRVGDVVARNQRMAVIANASASQPVCAGSEPPHIPHLHFVLRPTMVGATFAGWKFKYNAFWNTTSFEKDGRIVSLYKPLLNVMGSTIPTATPTGQATPNVTGTPGIPQATATSPASTPNPFATATSTGSVTATPNVQASATSPDTPDPFATPSNTPTPFPTLTPSGPTNTPDPFATPTDTPTPFPTLTPSGPTDTPDPFASATPTPFPTLTSVGPTQTPDPFATATATNPATNTPDPFATATAPSPMTNTPNPFATFTPTPAATNTLDPLATFTPTTASTLTPEPFSSAIPTPTAGGAFVSTTTGASIIVSGANTLATVTLHNVPAAGYSSAEFSCSFDPALVETSNILTTNLFGPDAVVVISGPQNGQFILAIAGAQGNQANTSGAVFTFSVLGLQPGQAALNCTARVSLGNQVLSPLPAVGTSLTILSLTPTPTSTPVPTLTLAPTVTAGATQPTDPWPTFTNLVYGFQFKYPPQGQIDAGGTDTFTRLHLPIQPGTNLGEKYLEAIVSPGANPCQSPLATQSILQSSQNVTLNGLLFLKQTGADAGAGNLHQWVAYSTQQGNTCVSLDFVLHSLNPGNFATPPPVFDYAAESAVFDQIVGTYVWLSFLPPVTSPPLASPTVTLTPAGSPTGMLVGQIISAKPATISVYDSNDELIVTGSVALDGRSFAITLSAGTYKLVASASGYLSAEGLFTVTSNLNTTVPTITLPAGDIDGNAVIDQFDALTIGMSYNTVSPAAADLNNDGIINVLDLEALAANYRKTGPIPWP